MVARTLRDLPKDLDKKISRDFNDLIKKVHRTLSTKKHSPVYTGFLASSWRAQKSQVRQKDRREDFEPWASIKREHDLPKGSEGWKPAGSKPSNPVIEPRFSPPTFDYRKGCFIGNQAEYSSYVIENPNIAKYVKNGVKSTIDQNFKEKKRGAIKIGSVQKKALFGKGSKKGRKYTGTSEF